MKKVLAVLMVTAFAFCVGTAFAKTEKCTVKTVAVEGEKATVTMECEKDAELKEGDTVKVRAQKKKVVEGC
ncbi:MAG: hypothetical protein WGN25_20510 [Candidatus Electrothrix sp. GW3-4]|uniref:hypothetical protein n=1 Tax=Candidatus Electrothrix sp. GW3-4 TaxID=3126740 RepID=UPI0030D032BF